MPAIPLKIDLPAPLADRLKAAAAETGESVEALVGRAVEAWLGDDAEDAAALAELERRWAAVEAGGAVSNEAVVRWLDTWGTPAFRPWRDQ